MRRAYERAITSSLSDSATGVLVDYGCGNMPYRSLFNAASYLGADFPGNELADIMVNDDGSLPIADNYASVVVSSQVLEHVADVPKYLKESYRVLAQNGLLFLSTHGMWRYHPDPGDYWRWTCDGLQRQISSAGFEIMSFQGVMGPESTALQLYQDSVSARIPKILRSCYHRYMQRRIQRADQRCSDEQRDRDACVYLVVARKINE